jgi:hypothetical protein
MNQFSKSEAELVEKIVAWIKKNRPMTEGREHGMILHFACGWVQSYASPEDYEAAVGAVLDLVKEKLNAVA